MMTKAEIKERIKFERSLDRDEDRRERVNSLRNSRGHISRRSEDIFCDMMMKFSKS